MSPLQFFGNILLNGIIDGLIASLLALALTLTFAVSRFHNVASGDYMTVGAYVAKAAGFSGGWSSVTAGLAGSASTAALAIFFHHWIFKELARRSHVSAAIASVGVSLVLRAGIALVFGTDPSTYRLPIVRATPVFGIFVQPTDLWLIGVSAAALIVVFGLLHLTPMGRRLRAIADNPDLARASGIRSARAMTMLWIVVGGLTATGGIMVAMKSVLYPALGWNLVLPGFTAAIVGGIRNPLGAVVGGLAVGIAQEFSSLLVGQSYKIAVCFVILALILLWRPQGLLGRIEGVR